MSEQERLNNDGEIGLDEGGRAVEQVLRGLVPARPGIDVTDVLRHAVRRSEAAVRSARQQIWLWRGVAAVLVASVVVMAWIVRELPPSQIIIERPALSASNGPARETVTGEPSAPMRNVDTAASQPPTASCAYLVLRQQVLAHGLDALHDAPGPGPNAPPPGDESPMRQLRAYDGGL